MIYTDNLFLMGDNDEAGIEANLHAIQDIDNSLHLFVVPLKEYNDPGEIPDKKTAQKLVAGAKDWSIFNSTGEILKQ